MVALLHNIRTATMQQGGGPSTQGMERHLSHAAAFSTYISAPVGIIYGPIRPWALPIQLRTNPYIKVGLESIKQVALWSFIPSAYDLLLFIKLPPAILITSFSFYRVAAGNKNRIKLYANGICVVSPPTCLYSLPSNLAL